MKGETMSQSPQDCNPSSILAFIQDGEKLPSCASEDYEMEVDSSLIVVEQTIEVGTSASTLSQVPQYSTIANESFYSQNAEPPLQAAANGQQLPEYDELRGGEDNTGRQELKPLEDMSDVNEIIKSDVKNISVKKLRSVIPRLRVACYYNEEDICGKKKVKNLWCQQPADWPESIPFKDPNNKGTKDREGSKPSKDDLVKMYTFLKDKYCTEVLHEEPNTVLSTHTPYQQSMVQSSQPVTYPTDDLRRIMKEEPSFIEERVPAHQKPGSPIYDLYQRTKTKMQNVLQIVANDAEAMRSVTSVDKEVMHDLYNRTDQMELSCAFLDAGHQFETLLDVVLTFGKDVAIDMLKQGCQELLDKFAPLKDEQTQSHLSYNSGTKALYKSVVASAAPSTLAPATGGPYIPRVEDICQRGQKIKVEPASPGITYGIEDLAIDMKSPGSHVDLSQFIETRSESKRADTHGKLDSEEAVNMDMDKFVQGLLDGEDVGKKFEITQVVGKDPSLQEAVLSDVLQMEDDYGVDRSPFDVNGFEKTINGHVDVRPLTPTQDELNTPPMPLFPAISTSPPALQPVNEPPSVKYEVLLTPDQLQNWLRSHTAEDAQRLLANLQVNSPPSTEQNICSPPSIPQTVMDFSGQLQHLIWVMSFLVFICLFQLKDTLYLLDFLDGEEIVSLPSGKRALCSNGGRTGCKRGRHN